MRRAAMPFLPIGRRRIKKAPAGAELCREGRF